MDADETLFKKRLSELAEKSYQNSQYLFTGFLSMAELDLFYRMERELSYVPTTLFGGTNDCERMVLRFGGEELCGYDEPFPITCIEITPIMEKFAEQLSHRDYLGALMNLGIERSTIGDIIINEKKAYLFCLDKMANYIIDNLIQIRHTHISCKQAEQVPETTITRLERVSHLVSSERADNVLAKVCHMSRSQVVELFRAKKIFINGRLTENNSGLLKAEDKVSVRGFGKFIYHGPSYETKKGKLSVEIDLYV